MSYASISGGSKKIRLGNETSEPVKRRLTPREELDLLSDLSFSEITSDSDNVSDSSDEEYISKKAVTEGLFFPQFLREGIAWNTWTPMSGHLLPFTKCENLLLPVSKHEPIDYFHHVLSRNILDEMIVQTNIYSYRLCQRLKLKKRTWKGLTRDEMNMFMGLSLLMGIVKLRRVCDYWKLNRFLKLGVIYNNMSFKRYVEIFRRLKFSAIRRADRGNSTDRLYKLRDLINSFNERMSEIYSPGCEIILDDPMIVSNGIARFRQECSMKRVKGLQLNHLITYPEGIIMKFSADFLSKDHPQKTAANLLDKFLDVGHRVYMNSYYSSFELSKYLLDRKTFCTAIIDRNKKLFPTEVKQSKLLKGESIARYCDGVMIAKWQDEKEMCYISNEHFNSIEETEDEYNRIVRKPLPIILSNIYKPSNDHKYRMLSNYPHQRKRLKWGFKIFMHILHLAVVNSYLLYDKYSGYKISFKEFRLIIIKCLIVGSNKTSGIYEHTLFQPEIKKGGKLFPRHCKSCFAKGGKRRDVLLLCSICEDSPAYCLDCALVAHRK